MTRMTEAEWLGCTDPGPRLEFLRTRASERKLRLFACACCRRVWYLLTDERSRRAVEVMERYADGAADSEDVYRAVIGAEAVAEALTARAVSAAEEAAASAATAALNTTMPDAARDADYCAANVASAVYHDATAGRARSAADARTAERVGQVRLLSEVFGNPFRPPSLPPHLLAWNDGTVPRLARAIYDERAFDRLPILADALEDAGCNDAEILTHCRGPKAHVRGCWVLDLLLDKS
jgi:hypothetical protein